MALLVPILAKFTYTQPHFYQLSTSELNSNRKINVEITRRNSLGPIRKSVACIAQTSTVLTLTSFYESPLHCMLFTTDNNVGNVISTYNHASKNNVSVAVQIFTKRMMGKLYHVTFYAAISIISL